MQSAALSHAPCASPLQADSAKAVPLPIARAQPAAIMAPMVPILMVPRFMLISFELEKDFRLTRARGPRPRED
jgi:hypothetical protein